MGLAIIVLGILLLLGILLARPFFAPAEQIYGVTFSQPHATGIGLDWQEVYDAILDDLQVKKLRLSAYWNVIEVEDDVFDFATVDYQMDKAAEHDALVILSIGRKLPRWPECHVPPWAQSLPEAEQQEKVLAMLRVVVERYSEHPALYMWQLENEPLFDFGGCPAEDRDFLSREEILIRSLDDHPIMITDSGELNSWLPAAAYGDVLGTTMYRTVFSSRTERLFRYDYIFPAWMYRAKARLVGFVRGKEVLISELQGEPWGSGSFIYLSVEERRESLSPDRFLQLQRFAERTQLPEAYWWGVEYWYWEKEVNGEDVFWEIAKTFFTE